MCDMGVAKNSGNDAQKSRTEVQRRFDFWRALSHKKNTLRYEPMAAPAEVQPAGNPRRWADWLCLGLVAAGDGELHQETASTSTAHHLGHRGRCLLTPRSESGSEGW